MREGLKLLETALERRVVVERLVIILLGWRKLRLKVFLEVPRLDRRELLDLALSLVAREGVVAGAALRTFEGLRTLGAAGVF